MKATKYILAALLLFLAFTLTGELHTWNVSGFEASYTNLVSTRSNSNYAKRALEIVQEEAAALDIEVFAVASKAESAFAKSITIYADDTLQAKIQKQSAVAAGIYDSTLTGRVTVTFQPISALTAKTPIQEIRLFGSSPNESQLQENLAERGFFVRIEAGHPYEDNPLMVGLLWGVVCVFLLLLTLYEVAALRKETAVQVLLGGNIWRKIGRHIAQDTAILLLLFLATLLATNHFTFTLYQRSLIFLIFGIFLALQAAAFLLLARQNYQADLKSRRSEKRVLRFSYGYKLATLVITMLMLAVSLQLATRGHADIVQNRFFQEYQSYGYITGVSGIELKSDIYSRLHRQGKTITLADLDTGLDDTEDLPHCLLVDSGAIPYLHKTMPEFSDLSLEEKVYFFIPVQYEGDTAVLKNVKTFWESFFQSSHAQEIRYYNGRNTLPAVEGYASDSESHLLDYPVIILNHLAEGTLGGSATAGLVDTVFHGTLFDISPEELAEMLQEYPDVMANNSITNAYDSFQYQWTMSQRYILLGLIVFVALLLLEATILHTILRLEYRVHAMELSLRYLHGYGILRTHGKLLLQTLLSGGISLLVASLISDFLFEASGAYVLAAGVILLLVEVALSCFQAYRMRRRNIQNILKGASI